MSRLDINSIELFLTGQANHAKPYRVSETGILYLSLPERMPHQERDDTQVHICKGGETLFSLANSYYRAVLDNPLIMAPIIADFQDPPIVDRSVTLDRGKVILIPSLSYKQEVVDGDTLTESPRM